MCVYLCIKLCVRVLHNKRSGLDYTQYSSRLSFNRYGSQSYLNREYVFFFVPGRAWRIWSLRTGSAVPPRVYVPAVQNYRAYIADVHYSMYTQQWYCNFN